MKVFIQMTAAAVLAVASVACSGGDGADADPMSGETSAEEEALMKSGVVLEWRDDGALHATGLSGANGTEWEHFAKMGDRVTLRNKSSKAAFFVVGSSSNWDEPRMHITLFRQGERVARELPAKSGRFSWTVPNDANRYSIRVYEDSSRGADLVQEIVSESDQSHTFPAILRIEQP